MDQEPLNLFVENLLRESKLNLPTDFKAQYIEKLKEQVNRRLGIALMENLDEAALTEFSELMSVEPQPDFRAVEKFYQEKIPNVEQKIQAALAEFATDFITASQK